MNELKIQTVNNLKDAWGLIPQTYAADVKESIRKIIGVKNTSNIYDYLNGRFEPKVSQAIALNELFNKYGIDINWSKVTLN